PTAEPTVEPTVKPTAEPTVQPVTHNFTVNGKTSDFFAITGSTTTSKGTVSYQGMSLTTCIKMETATNITFTTERASSLKMVFSNDCTRKIEVDGQVYAVKNGILEIELTAGAHSIKKADTNVNLYYIEVK
ncbi:MAG: pectate lyase, partial [bacterium]|nr:pectate lyase [bacterium]